MLRPEEVEMLVCGNPTLNMAELKKVTVYDGYSSRDPTIKYEPLLIAHLLGCFHQYLPTGCFNNTDVLKFT